MHAIVLNIRWHASGTTTGMLKCKQYNSSNIQPVTDGEYHRHFVHSVVSITHCVNAVQSSLAEALVRVNLPEFCQLKQIAA